MYNHTNHTLTCTVHVRSQLYVRLTSSSLSLLRAGLTDPKLLQPVHLSLRIKTHLFNLGKRERKRKGRREGEREREEERERERVVSKVHVNAMDIHMHTVPCQNQQQI